MPKVFAAIFSSAETPPTRDQLETQDGFYKYSKELNLPALGTDGLEHEPGEKDEGFFFSGYPGVLVEEILQKFPKP